MQEEIIPIEPLVILCNHPRQRPNFSMILCFLAASSSGLNKEAGYYTLKSIYINYPRQKFERCEGNSFRCILSQGCGLGVTQHDISMLPKIFGLRCHDTYCIKFCNKCKVLVLELFVFVNFRIFVSLAYTTK